MTTYGMFFTMNRRSYKTCLRINNRQISVVIVDPHYEAKHGSSIDDQIILELVKMLDGGTFPAADVVDDFEYYVTDSMSLHGKLYKLVWLLEKNQLYVGIVNVYRRKK